jgi:hypothetical protein
MKASSTEFVRRKRTSPNHIAGKSRLDRLFFDLGHSGMCGRNSSSTIVSRRLLMLFNKGIIECLDNMKEEAREKVAEKF